LVGKPAFQLAGEIFPAGDSSEELGSFLFPLARKIFHPAMGKKNLPRGKKNLGSWLFEMGSAMLPFQG